MFYNLKRISLDVILFLATLGLFAIHQYASLPAPLQLLALKAMLVSGGILHAHIARKLIFPKVDWTSEKITGNIIAALIFYIIIIYAYAIGG